MTACYPFALSLVVRAPFLQNGLAQASIGYDATPLTDQRGRIIVSGDQVEGYVKAVMNAAGAPTARWFVEAGIQIEDGLPEDRPSRAPVKIFDLVADDDPSFREWHSIARNRGNEESGATDPGSLHVIAQSHKPGAAARFTGEGWILADDEDWRLRTHLRFTSHRGVLGPIIIFVKRRVLLPLTRWLYEYSLENFRRQQRINQLLFACLEELALENARLRKQLDNRPTP